MLSLLNENKILAAKQDVNGEAQSTTTMILTHKLKCAQAEIDDCKLQIDNGGNDDDEKYDDLMAKIAALERDLKAERENSNYWQKQNDISLDRVGKLMTRMNSMENGYEQNVKLSIAKMDKLRALYL